MGAGKTTIGRLLAMSLGIRFIDSDVLVIDRTGLTSAQVAATTGVDELHRVERAVLVAALAEEEPAVVAAAASVVDEAEAREALSRHRCVWVDASPATRRRRSGAHRRPIDGDEQSRLDEARRPYLERLCTAMVDTSAATPSQCIEAIRSSLSI